MILARGPDASEVNGVGIRCAYPAVDRGYDRRVEPAAPPSLQRLQVQLFSLLQIIPRLSRAQLSGRNNHSAHNSLNGKPVNNLPSDSTASSRLRRPL